tara:strand:+ start:151 stop:426 length:276 start_codon:yes stop_codon:yes gene_type:complete
MRTKIENIQDLNYNNNQTLIGELITKWIKAKPKNKELIDLRDAFIDNAIYVACLQNELMACKMANSDYREQRNDALLELDELKDEMKQYDL